MQRSTNIAQAQLQALTSQFAWLDIPSALFCLQVVTEANTASSSGFSDDGGVIDAGVIYVRRDKNSVPVSNAAGLRVVCISDTHCLHDKIPLLPRADVLIHSGGGSAFVKTNFVDFIYPRRLA